jgi:hypothetical protein
VRLGERQPAFAEIPGVGIECFPDAFGDLVATDTERQDAREIGKVRAPCAGLGLFVDDDVFAHRRSAMPLARRTLPTATSQLVRRLSSSLPRLRTVCRATGRSVSADDR